MFSIKILVSTKNLKLTKSVYLLFFIYYSSADNDFSFLVLKNEEK